MDESRVLRNREAFDRLFPHIKAQAPAQQLSRIVFDDGEAVDVDLGAGRLYKTDGRRFAVEQVEAFLAHPCRIGYELKGTATGDSPISKRIFQALTDSVRAHDVKVLVGAPTNRVGYVFVYGLGLGHHLTALVDGLEVDNIVIGESIFEFVLHARDAVDWQALSARCDERGIKLHLVVGDNPLALMEGMNEVVTREGELLLDGSYFYRHYPSWVLDNALDRMVENVPLMLVGRGYYEDERKMVRNAAACLQKFDHQMISGDVRPALKNVPAFLVASGPSLDNDLEYIKQWRDHVILISGGSSLEPLLSEGLIPDYHVELENVVQVYDMCMHMLDTHPHLFPERRFTGLKLIASVTVNPRVPPLFDETYFFFRDSVTSTHSFGYEVPVTTAVGPCIANTITAVAPRLGLHEIYMFGMDCGWRDGASHHSKKTAYYTSKTFRTEKMQGTYTFPGNFGGTIQSDLIFSWTRDMLEQKCTRLRIKAFNCSDGALIKGAVPKLAETIEFSGPPLDRAKVIDTIRAGTTFYRAGAFLKTQDMGALVRGVDAFAELVDQLCQDALADGHDFLWFRRRLTEINHNWRETAYGRIYPFFSSATFNLAKHACVIINRITEEDKRRQVYEDFIACYRAIHDEMIHEVRTIYGEIQTWVEEGGPEPFWADGMPMAPGYTW